MEWPPQTPDFNPIEKLWNMLEKASGSGPTLPSPVQDHGGNEGNVYGNKSCDIVEAC